MATFESTEEKKSWKHARESSSFKTFLKVCIIVFKTASQEDSTSLPDLVTSCSFW